MVNKGKDQPPATTTSSGTASVYPEWPSFQPIVPPYGTPPPPPYVMYPPGTVYAHPPTPPAMHPFGHYPKPTNGHAETHGKASLAERLLHPPTGLPRTGFYLLDSHSKDNDGKEDGDSQNSMSYSASQGVVNQTMVMLPMQPGAMVGGVPSSMAANLNIGVDYWAAPSSAAVPAAHGKAPAGSARGDQWENTSYSPQTVFVQDERELKKQKRKQSNREFARRSRLRKQVYPFLPNIPGHTHRYKQTEQETRPYLSLQLFGSTEEDFPPKMDSMNKYLSYESSNPLDERSPSSSLPITRKFFPIHSVDEEVWHPHITDYGEDATMGEVSTNQAWLAPPLDLFKDSERPIENGSPPNPGYQSCYASTSCSDHSTSTSNSDGQDRTGRIIFKLFGKEPSIIPRNLRDDIVNWLKHSPTEKEGYICPGCLVLSMYLLMQGIAWDELEENLLQRVNSLVQSSDLDFWRKGRFLVRTNSQLVSYKAGMTRLSKSWRTWNTPELTLVSPIAVVGGQKTSLILKGHNLSIPGTQIHCTSIGKYISKEVLCSAYPGTIYDDSGVETFDLTGKPDLIIGRCFVEVENRFRGNSFPVIGGLCTLCFFEEDVVLTITTPRELNNYPRKDTFYLCLTVQVAIVQRFTDIFINIHQDFTRTGYLNSHPILYLAYFSASKMPRSKSSAD
ncbi:Squamosa promoter-binding-like protein 15 [Zea mays]|uniref:Squamosa promoter-binding-like protein 15 n=1 Tax=Zea mays TaxID=4577 RepID=A0A317Y3Q3_MAIZE|nr:Squamosa promoter-binding-like protein 15 [Zea mays]